MARVVLSDTLGGLTLTSRSFPDFYVRIAALRFPISVAEVLELRDLINHSADIYDEPPDAPQNREFRDSLENAIHSFGIENRHHCERLVRVLAMFRGMHYQHTIASRDAERRLRQRQADNRKIRRRNLRFGVLALIAMVAGIGAWLFGTNSAWLAQTVALGAAVVALGYFHSLPRLDRAMEQHTLELNEVLRKRVDALNWRTLIHKLSLLLGYKKIQGIEVFAPEAAENTDKSRYFH